MAPVPGKSVRDAFFSSRKMKARMFGFANVAKLAICKLQDGQQLERYETAVLKSFEVEKPDASSSEEEESLSLAARALKRRKVQQRTSACYVDTRFVVPTSTMCERLFYVAGWALNWATQAHIT